MFCAKNPLKYLILHFTAYKPVRGIATFIRPIMNKNTQPNFSQQLCNITEANMTAGHHLVTGFLATFNYHCVKFLSKCSSVISVSQATTLHPTGTALWLIKSFFFYFSNPGLSFTKKYIQQLFHEPELDMK